MKILETNQLSKYYGDQTALNKVSITINQGVIYGLIGRNGAGKTTLMKLILNLIKRSSGNIKMFGEEIDGNSNIFNNVGCSIESPAFYPNLTASENLKYFMYLRGIKDPKRIKKVLDTVELPSLDKKEYRNFSLGMKQRLAIAKAILLDPEFVILDEPSNGLDPIGIIEIRELIKRLSTQEKKTILLSSHQLAEIEQTVDYIGIIDHGKLLLEDSLQELKSRLMDKSLETYFFELIGGIKNDMYIKS